MALRTLLIFLLFIGTQVHANDFPKELERSLAKLKQEISPFVLVASVKHQTLTLFHQKKAVRAYVISTAKNGIGSVMGSYQTPLGMHRIASKIGDQTAIYSVFRARKSTGELWNPRRAEKDKGKDLILSRVMPLSGLERGINLGRNKHKQVVDSQERMIYIHGTNQEQALGTPASHGCIRMSNRDVIDLFDRVPAGTLVWIHA